MVTGKRQVTPSLVDVSSSAERLRKLSVTRDREKPVSSRLAYACTAAIVTADAADEERLEAPVRRAYVTLGLKEVARTATLPFPASVKKAPGAQQLTRSVKVVMTEILMHSNDHCTAGLTFPSRVPGWDLPLHEAFMRAITPDKPTTADMTTLIDRVSAGVERRQGRSLWSGGF